MKHQFTRDESIRGGKIVAALPGGKCPKCGDEFDSHASLAAHLGLHGFADKYCGGDIVKARHLFSITGAAASDPYPSNGAFAEGHKMLALFRGKKQDSVCPF